SIRLVGSSNNYEGRLEVYHNSQWGTVCDDIWDSDNNGATVACSQLGFSGVQSYNTKTFGEGIDPIWLDDVTCNGNETRIQDCSRYGGLWGNHNCAHSEDVGIICSP
ncbi:Neurotrypsin, partial [Exaiptasia diaphana]